jgi:hypothetical protein
VPGNRDVDVWKLSKAGGADFAEPVTCSDNVSRFDSQTALSQVAVLDFVAVPKLHNQTVAAFLSRNAPGRFRFQSDNLALGHVPEGLFRRQQRRLHIQFPYPL